MSVPYSTGPAAHLSGRISGVFTHMSGAPAGVAGMAGMARDGRAWFSPHGLSI